MAFFWSSVLQVWKELGLWFQAALVGILTLFLRSYVTLEKSPNPIDLSFLIHEMGKILLCSVVSALEITRVKD